MKNSSLSLLIMLPILLVSIGMYTYTSSQSTIIDSNTSMSTAEIEGRKPASGSCRCGFRNSGCTTGLAHQTTETVWL